MPPIRTATESPPCQAQDRRAAVAAGPNGIALAPPAYGIDVVDQAAASAGPLQCMSGPALMRGSRPHRDRCNRPNDDSGTTGRS